MGQIKNLLSAAVLGASLSFTSIAPAQGEELSYYTFDGVTYDQSVLKPDDFLGFGIGDKHVSHHQMVGYLERVATASDRMKVETIGYSHEGRPIIFLTISSPENMAKLDSIRDAHLAQVAGAPLDTDQPVITWVNYGVHGSEPSSLDAVLPAVYHLAAAQGEEIENTLDKSVILITAVFNPDGHNRREGWVTSYGTDIVATDPAHDIHNVIWPGGRTNHYWFDLNRQWLLQTQPESRAWLSQWHKWKPHVSGDFHEMGSNSTYYFHPGIPTRKNPLIPDQGRKLLDQISQYHTRYFDSEQKLYYTEESFDNFYVGKGSTYPQVNGGLGILFEAGGQMGIAKDSDQGVKTHANNTRNHMRTSLTTIAGAVAMRETLIRYQHGYFDETSELAEQDPVKGYIFTAPEDPTRLYKFTDLLSRHQIAFSRTSEDIQVNGTTYPAGSYYASLNQRQYRMAKSFFSRLTEFQDKVFYDVSGWTLPLAYGMMHDEVTTKKMDTRLTSGGTAQPTMPIAERPDEAPYAYLFSSAHYYAHRALNRLLEAGLMARLGLEPMTIPTTKGDVALERGAIIVPFENQSLSASEIHGLMERIAREDGITVHAATSGRSVEPGSDLGGRNSVYDIKPVRPLMIVGQGVSPYDAGEVWHQLDHRMKIGLTITRKENMRWIDWNNYTHLIVVGGRVPFNERQTKAIQNWVRGGGTVIASRQGASWAADHLLNYTPEKSKKATPERLPYSVKSQKDAEQVIGGAIFESTLDLSHPIAFGLVRDQLAMHRNTTIKLPVPKDPYAQVAVYTEKPLLSGYASEERQEQLKGSPSVVAERLGRGSVILFADNPNFRATYLGAEKLYLNALFYSTAFYPARGEDE